MSDRPRSSPVPPVWALVLLALGLLSCDPSLDRARAGLKIGYAVEAPYAFVAADGRVTGESPEIARVVADRLGLGPLEWRQVDFSRLFDELRAGKIDVVAAGTFITAERQKLVAFSRPTFRVREGVLVRVGNPQGLGGFGRAQTPGPFRFAVLAGAVEEDFLLARGWSASDLVLVPDALTGLATVTEGLADGLVLSAPTLRLMAARSSAGTLEVQVPAEADNPGDLGGFAFRPADRALREAWDRTLAGFVGSPAHRALVQPFGFAESELP